MDLMDMVKDAVDKQTMSQIGGMLGTDEEKTFSVFETAVGSIMGGLIKKASTPDGALDVFDVASKQEDGILDNLGDVLDGGAMAETVQVSGGSILEGMFNARNKEIILGTLSKFLEIDEKKLDRLMKLLAFIVMTVFGRHINSKSLDPVGSASFLDEQTKCLGFMASSLTKGLGFEDLLNSAGDSGQTLSGAAKSGGDLVKLLVPLVVLLTLTFSAWKLLPLLTDRANQSGQGAMGTIEKIAIPGLDRSKIEGFDLVSSAAAGPKLPRGFRDITTGLENLEESGEAGANALAEEIKRFSGTIDGLGLADLSDVGKESASGLIGEFIEVVDELLSGKSDEVQSILKPEFEALIEKLNSVTR